MTHPRIDIRIDDLSGEPTQRLIATHLAGMHETSPPESVHALDMNGLQHPSITFWSAWIDDELAGIGALKTFGERRGELKSMRVDDRFRGHGVGRALLVHIIADSRSRASRACGWRPERRRTSFPRSASTRVSDSPCADPSRATAKTRSRCT